MAADAATGYVANRASISGYGIEGEQK